MRIQIVKLDENDDMVSARDKLSWGKTSRLILVWPERAPILSSKLDLTLLNRYCKSNGSQLGLVARDPLVQKNARALGIPVFASEEQALKSRWKRTLKTEKHRQRELTDFRAWKNEITPGYLLSEEPNKAKWWERKSVRIISFTLAILAVVALSWLFVPSAQIVLSPKSKTQDITLSVMASEQSKVVNISGVLPLKTLSVTVEGEANAQATGTASEGDKIAAGQVTFTNLTNQAMDIPVGTVVESLSSVDVKYQTTAEKTLPGGNGNTVLVPIAAVEAGTNGNAATGEITAIEGSLGMQATVTNPEPISGGTDKETSIVSTADHQALHNQLVQSMQTQAIAQLRAKLAKDDVLIEDTVGKTNILDEVSDPAENQPANEFTLSMRIEFTAQYIAATDLSQLGTLNMDATLSNDLEPVSDSLSFSLIGDPARDTDQNIRLQVKFSRTIQSKLAIDQVPGEVMGLQQEKAISKLEYLYPLAVTPKIYLTPSWWPDLPMVPFRISVVEKPYADNGH